MQIYKILARLLDYPDEELMSHMSELRDELFRCKDISETERRTLLDFVTWVGQHDTTGIQEDYVQTFDMTPEHDLHLTHHLFGEDNDRGPALIDLSEHYKRVGLENVDSELPDYLPLILEYLSVLDAKQAHEFLADASKVLAILSENLEKADSPYAGLIRIIESRGLTSLAA